MTRTFVIASLVIAVSTTAWFIGSYDRLAAQSTGGLPGAKPTIEAANYPSLQAAIDALPEGGGVVRLPAGKFQISKPLVLRTEDVLIEGQGTGTHIENTNTEGEPALLIHPNEALTAAKKKMWRVQLQNFRITGNEKSGHGIQAVLVNEFFVQGVTVSYHGGDGIHMDRCTEDPRIADSLITYNKKTGITILGGHDIIVCGNHLEENLDALQCIDAFNLCMSGNNVDDHIRNGIVIENTYGSIVSSNMIEECKGTALILDRDCYGITLAANTIAHHQQGGIDLRDAHGIAVTGNTFPLVVKNALVIGPKSGRITVTGNTFTNTYIGDATKRKLEQDPSSGITLSGTTDIVITGNVFSGLVTKGLTLDGDPSRRVTFTANVLTDVESDHAKLVDSQVADNVVAP